MKTTHSAALFFVTFLTAIGALGCPPTYEDPCAVDETLCSAMESPPEGCLAGENTTLDMLLGTVEESWASRFVSVACVGASCIEGGAVVFKSVGYEDNEDAALSLYGTMFGSSACGDPYVPVQRMELDTCGTMKADSDYQEFVFGGQFYWDESLVAGTDYHMGLGVEDNAFNALQLLVSRKGESMMVTLHRADPDGTGFYETYVDEALEGTVCEE